MRTCRAVDFCVRPPLSRPRAGRRNCSPKPHPTTGRGREGFGCVGFQPGRGSARRIGQTARWGYRWLRPVPPAVTRRGCQRCGADESDVARHPVWNLRLVCAGRARAADSSDLGLPDASVAHGLGQATTEPFRRYLFGVRRRFSDSRAAPTRNCGHFVSVM